MIVVVLKMGMFISVPLELRDITKDVSPNHWRVQAIVITRKQLTALRSTHCFVVYTNQTNYRVENVLNFQPFVRASQTTWTAIPD
jgi:hypothetical protein